MKNKRDHLLDKAEQQIYGWHCANAGETLSAIVDGMGLTKEEWNYLKRTNLVEYLTDSERHEIDGYF